MPNHQRMIILIFININRIEVNYTSCFSSLNYLFNESIRYKLNTFHN